MDHPPGAERLAAALTRSDEYRMLPCFGWMILIVRDHKNALLFRFNEPTAYAPKTIPTVQHALRGGLPSSSNWKRARSLASHYPLATTAVLFWPTKPQRVAQAC